MDELIARRAQERQKEAAREYEKETREAQGKQFYICCPFDDPYGIVEVTYDYHSREDCPEFKREQKKERARVVTVTMDDGRLKDAKGFYHSRGKCFVCMK